MTQILVTIFCGYAFAGIVESRMFRSLINYYF
ncbi:hypothetical protein ACVQ90_09655 [Staphylococcus aureus]